ncbi:CopD family protein [Accumulibacter sp.]|uniref:CopD family protein n=1 Tax=Accumulibacter sp. TaxID=2053492 RepID=UPI0025F1F217|nr:CopD family protein [Accumulibacter sp.]MCM8594414.1 CopD family protein [Accumulibacter sp.]MDS4048559.1 CopD family protein [Accumulibacter sp.]
MLIVKVLHIWMVVSWFAGLFYLPRIFVNLAMVERSSVAERARLLLMAGKLYRFMTPIGVLAVVLGFWLWFGFGFGGGWLHAKTGLVGVLVGYHLWCGRLLRDFEADRNTRGPLWFRWFNEMPVLILLAVTYLAVLKPF